MKTFPSAFLLFLLQTLCSLPNLHAASTQTTGQLPPSAALWTSAHAEHVYGFPDMKPHKKGTLTLTPDALTFSGKSGNTSIPRTAVTAVSSGNQRVEMWGIGGRLLRMTIPDGGGVAAAAFMHHRVDLLTVEFNDGHGATHGAVFLLPANEAEHALASFTVLPTPPHKSPEFSCTNAPPDPRSVVVTAPVWDAAQVPAAYRTLVYEHVIDRLQRTSDIGHVYRDGEGEGHGGCPQYTIHIAIASFREGSSVKRAILGPVGMFVGTTQIKFDVLFTDASGKLNSSQQIKATIRGESESTNIADHLAKTLAKHFAAIVKEAAKNTPPRPTTPPLGSAFLPPAATETP